MSSSELSGLRDSFCSGGWNGEKGEVPRLMLMDSLRESSFVFSRICGGSTIGLPSKVLVLTPEPPGPVPRRCLTMALLALLLLLSATRLDLFTEPLEPRELAPPTSGEPPGDLLANLEADDGWVCDVLLNIFIGIILK